MYLTKQLRVKKHNSLVNNRFKFNIYDKSHKHYIAENFEQFFQQKPNSYLYITYKKTETYNVIKDHAIYSSNQINPTFLVANISSDNWKKIHNKRLILKNILEKEN